MSTRLRTLVATTLVATTLCIAPSPASAGPVTWTAVATGTTSDLVAVEYREDKIWFATNTGQIYTGAPTGPFSLSLNAPGVVFSDLSVNPAGTTALAVGDSATLYRYSGGAWTQVVGLQTYSVAGTTSDNSCDNQPKVLEPITENLLAVEWITDTEAYVAVKRHGSLLRTNDAGATFAEVGRTAAGECKVNGIVTDVEPVPGAPGRLWFATDYFGSIFQTTDNLASPAVKKKELVNCFSVRMSIAVDPVSPGRISAAGACTGTLHWGATLDAGTTSDYIDDAATSPGEIFDLDAVAGTFVAVGNGQIERSTDGKKGVDIGDGTTTGWRSIDFNGVKAAVGGVGGRLILTADINAVTPPPLPPPLPPPNPGPAPLITTVTYPSAPPVVGGAAKLRKGTYKIKVRGSFGIPAGATTARSCKGTVKIVVKKGAKKIVGTSTGLSSSCTYATTIKIRKAKLRGVKKLTLALSFSGNDYLLPSSHAYKIRVKR